MVRQIRKNARPTFHPLLAIVLGLGACRAGGGVKADAARQSDTGFAAMQLRGQTVMGVDQYTSAHVFEDLPDGGRIVLDRADSSDTNAVAAIRQHMRAIAATFRAGNFAKPFQVHARVVPGTAIMAVRVGRRLGSGRPIPQPWRRSTRFSRSNAMPIMPRVTKAWRLAAA